MNSYSKFYDSKGKRDSLLPLHIRAFNSSFKFYPNYSQCVRAVDQSVELTCSRDDGDHERGVCAGSFKGDDAQSQGSVSF